MFDLSNGMANALELASIILFAIGLVLVLALIAARHKEPGTATNYAVLNMSFWFVMAAAFVLSAITSAAVWTGVLWFVVAGVTLIAAFVRNPTEQ